MVKSAYIHIPFCKQKCKYCSFVSYPCLEKISEYVAALLAEIQEYYKGEPLKTLYFGGGTPSLLDIQYIKNIMQKFTFEQDCEVTFELNPDDASFVYLKELFEVGINRISIGSQSFDDCILSSIGRRHNSEQIIKTVYDAKKAGFQNISLDLIYGLPTQTLKSITDDLERLFSLGIQHISTYGLKIEENSFWGKYPPEGIPDEDIQAEMYLAVNDYLESKGYHRYEISNFALKGYESRHNLNYWDNDEYYGFGVAAHGYVDSVRYSNYCSIDEYLNKPIEHEYSHCQTEQEKLEEEIFLGFRKEDGINLNRIRDRFGVDFEAKYENIIKKYEGKWLVKTSKGYKLTIDGVLLSNNILSEFI